MANEEHLFVINFWGGMDNATADKTLKELGRILASKLTDTDKFVLVERVKPADSNVVIKKVFES